MNRRCSHVNCMFGQGFPARQLFAISNVFVQNIDRTTPHMEIMEFALFPLSASEEIGRANASFGAWHVIEEIHSMLHSHQPKGRIRHIRPMNGSMQHHCSGHGHDGLNGVFCSAIVMGTGSHEVNDLGKVSEFGSKAHQGEGRTIIGQVSLWYNAVVPTHQLEIVFRIDGFMGVQIHLKLHMKETGSMVHKQKKPPKYISESAALLPMRGEEASFGAADEVVNGNVLARNKIVLFQDPFVVPNNRGHLTRSRMSSLFTVKASSKLGKFFQVTNGGVEAPLMFQHGKDTGSHDKEDPFEVQMAEMKVPMKKLFLRFQTSGKEPFWKVPYLFI